jgi:hypothetical protein
MGSREPANIPSLRKSHKPSKLKKHWAKNINDVQPALRQIFENGTPMSPEMAQAMNMPQEPPNQEEELMKTIMEELKAQPKKISEMI